MSSAVQDIQKEKQQYWKIFFTLVALNVLVVFTRNIPIIFWVGVISAFSTVLLLFMHLKTEKKLIHLIIFVLTIPVLIGLVVLIVFSNSSVPEGTKYLNFDHPPKPMNIQHEEHHGS